MARSQRRPWRLARNSTPGNFHGFKDSLWDDPDDPSCAICGQLILADPNARRFFDLVDDFNTASGNKFYIKLTVPKLHEFLADGQCDWRSTYRASKFGFVPYLQLPYLVVYFNSLLTCEVPLNSR